LPPTIESALPRIAQEALVNAVAAALQRNLVSLDR
jgi:hypothetical protein